MTFAPQPKPRARMLEREDARGKQDKLDALMRAEVRERDGWRCRVCGRVVKIGAVLPSQRAEVHHVVPRSLAPERVRDLSNQILVCGYHHEQLRQRELELVDSRGRPATNQANCHVTRGPNYRPGR